MLRSPKFWQLVAIVVVAVVALSAVRAYLSIALYLLHIAVVVAGVTFCVGVGGAIGWMVRDNPTTTAFVKKTARRVLHRDEDNEIDES